MLLITRIVEIFHAYLFQAFEVTKKKINIKPYKLQLQKIEKLKSHEITDYLLITHNFKEEYNIVSTKCSKLHSL